MTVLISSLSQYVWIFHYTQICRYSRVLSNTLCSCAVKSTCKQHEAEKKYLEDELKSKGNQRKHVSKPTPRQPVDSTTTDENMPSELTAAAAPPDDSKKMAAAPHPRKEINILEDLDKEFNKRVMLKPEDLMSCLDAPREEKLFSIASREAKKPDKVSLASYMGGYLKYTIILRECAPSLAQLYYTRNLD